MMLPITLLVNVGHLEAQPINKASLEMNWSAADMLFQEQEYYAALGYYRDVYSENKSLEVYERMAYCYYQIRDYGRAERYFARLLRRPDVINYDHCFTYGRILKMLGKNDEAREAFRQALASTDPMMRWRTEQELKGMLLANSLSEDPKIAINNAGEAVNQNFGEISPYLIEDDTLLFSAINTRSPIELKEGGKDGAKRYAQLYMAGLYDGEYIERNILKDDINDDRYNIVHPSLTPDGRYLYYMQVLDDAQNGERYDMMVAERNDKGEWGAPNKLSTPAGWQVKQAVFSVYRGISGFFFVANRPNGQGGDDIYFSKLEKGGLGTPQNLGASINTKADEWTPQFVNNVLYFSSNGHPTLGGFDCFSSAWNGGEWMPVENLGPSFNSTVDDFNLKWNSSLDKAVLLSNRPGGNFLRSETCCDDIYIITKKPYALAVEFEVFSDINPLKKVEINMIDITDGKNTKIKTWKKDSYNAYFTLDLDKEYRFVASKDGHFSDSMIIKTFGITNDSVMNSSLVLPRIIEPEEEIVQINQTIRLNNIYYDYDDDKILKDAEEDLTYLLELLNKYPDMIIELGSHTDARGSDKYNEELSKRRASSAKRWIVAKGVNPGRIRAIGYGEKQLLNGCVNGVSCTDEEHRINRRTEFKIIEGPDEIVIERKKLAKKSKEVKPEVKVFNRPYIRFERSFIDLGRVKRGDHPEMVFSFVNDGKGEVQIEIVTGCECTELSWTESPIKPGEKGEIRATLLSEQKDRDGWHLFDIDVVSNTEELSHLLEYRAYITN